MFNVGIQSNSCITAFMVILLERELIKGITDLIICDVSNQKNVAKEM